MTVQSTEEDSVFRDEAQRAEARILGPWVPEPGTESEGVAVDATLEPAD
jgi:hypothetical protein